MPELADIDIQALLGRAEDNKLNVTTDGSKVFVRGPKDADADLVQAILFRKAEVIEHLNKPVPRAQGPSSYIPAPDTPTSPVAAKKLVPLTSPLPAELLDGLRREVAAMMAVPSWEAAWAMRLQSAKYADMDALRRVIQMNLDQASVDAAGFQSWRKYILRFASGEIWDETARRSAAARNQ